MIEVCLKENELDLLINNIEPLLNKSNIILLRGNLGSGKTTLVKYFAKKFGINDNEVSSPTFSIMNRYSNEFFHYDIYNNGVEGMVENGLFENLEQKGVHIIEWGDEKFEKLLNNYGFSYIIISIDVKDDKRYYKVINA